MEKNCDLRNYVKKMKQFSLQGRQKSIIFVEEFIYMSWNKIKNTKIK